MRLILCQKQSVNRAGASADRHAVHHGRVAAGGGARRQVQPREPRLRPPLHPVQDLVATKEATETMN